MVVVVVVEEEGNEVNGVDRGMKDWFEVWSQRKLVCELWSVLVLCNVVVAVLVQHFELKRSSLNWEQKLNTV